MIIDEWYALLVTIYVYLIQITGVRKVEGFFCKPFEYELHLFVDVLTSGYVKGDPAAPK